MHLQGVRVIWSRSFFGNGDLRLRNEFIRRRGGGKVPCINAHDWEDGMELLRRDEDLAWLDWGTGPGEVPRYKTYFSAEDTGTTGLLQGTLVYPPGARVVPHWHSPVETYFVLSGTGAAHVGEDTFRLTPGTAVFVPTQIVHWFENDSDAQLVVFWTLACDAMADLDFTPVA